MYSQWISALDMKFADRTKDKLEEIYINLRTFGLFKRLHPVILRKLCKYVYIEFLDKGVFLFKQGDEVLNWYSVLCGSIDVQISQTGKIEDSVTICTLGKGTEFSDSLFTGKAHSISAFTNEKCTLLRVKRDIFCKLWKKNIELTEDELSPIEHFEYTISNNKNLNSNHANMQNLNENASFYSHLETNAIALNATNPNLNQFQLNPTLTNIDANRSASVLPCEHTCLNQAITNCKICIHADKELNLVTNCSCEDMRKRPISHQNSNSFQAASEYLNQKEFLAETIHQNRNQSNPSPSCQAQSDQSKFVNTSQVKQPEIDEQNSMQNSIVKHNFLNRKSVNNVYAENDVNTTVLRIAEVLRTLICAKAPDLMQDRKSEINLPQDLSTVCKQQLVLPRTLIGCELVNWLLSASASTQFRLHSRFQASSMWQVLVEEGALRQLSFDDNNLLSIQSINCKKNSNYRNNFFEDKYIFYKFCFDCDDFALEHDCKQLNLQQIQNKTNYMHFNNENENEFQTNLTIENAENEFSHCLFLLDKFSPNAMFRKILQKTPEERTPEEVDLVYMKLMPIKALSSLSNYIRQELAQVVQYESHKKCGSIVFNQGETGFCWYIILRGSVNVIILGKDTVCTLSDGDDFGNLAIVNESTRVATIITNEDNCEFLKVTKPHFDKIMHNAEDKTVRLREHDSEVLVLQKMCTKLIETSSSNLNEGLNKSETSQLDKNIFKYMVMAGTPDKIVEYLLETRIFLNKDPDTLLNNCHIDKNVKNLMLNGSLLYNVFNSSLTSLDTFLEDFLLTYQIYLTNFTLCKFLLKYYKIDQHHSSNTLNSKDLPGKASNLSDTLKVNRNSEIIIRNKRIVIRFIRTWLQVAEQQFFTDKDLCNFLNEINKLFEQDLIKYENMLDTEITIFNSILEQKKKFDQEMQNRSIKQWKTDVPSSMRKLSINGVTSDLISNKNSIIPNEKLLNRTNSTINKNIFSSLTNTNSISILTSTLSNLFNQLNSTLNLNVITPENDLLPSNYNFNVIQAKDEMISRVYCANHTYITLKLPVDSTAQTIKMLAAEKLKLISHVNQKEQDEKCKKSDEFVLVEIKSNGERILFKENEISIQTGLSLNGRLFVSLINHLDALTPLKEQLEVGESSYNILEKFDSLDLSYYLTFYSWSLFKNVHEYEFIYHVFGKHNFNQITCNLDVFLKHFNEIQFWVVTEICLQPNLSKRVNLLKKFIKIANSCKDYQNLNTFFAIILGLSNIAVSRLTQTWEKLPQKLKLLFSQFESLIDPSRNHHKYRMYLSKLSAPIIPFTPLLLKDMTFAHEGNLTFIGKGMINFEKMHMIAQTLRVIKFCKSKNLCLENFSISTSNASFPSNSNQLTPNKGSLIKINSYIRDLKVIDDQNVLNKLSQELEHRK